MRSFRSPELYRVIEPARHIYLDYGPLVLEGTGKYRLFVKVTAGESMKVTAGESLSSELQTRLLSAEKSQRNYS